MDFWMELLIVNSNSMQNVCDILYWSTIRTPLLCHSRHTWLSLWFLFLNTTTLHYHHFALSTHTLHTYSLTFIFVSLFSKMSSFKLGLLVCLWCVLLSECRHSKDASVPRSQWTLCWLRLCSGGGPGDCELRPGRAQLWGVWGEQRQGGELQAAGW